MSMAMASRAASPSKATSPSARRNGRSEASSTNVVGREKAPHDRATACSWSSRARSPVGDSTKKWRSRGAGSATAMAGTVTCACMSNRSRSSAGSSVRQGSHQVAKNAPERDGLFALRDRRALSDRRRHHPLQAGRNGTAAHLGQQGQGRSRRAMVGPMPSRAGRPKPSRASLFHRQGRAVTLDCSAHGRNTPPTCLQQRPFGRWIVSCPRHFHNCVAIPSIDRNAVVRRATVEHLARVSE